MISLIRYRPFGSFRRSDQSFHSVVTSPRDLNFNRGIIHGGTLRYLSGDADYGAGLMCLHRSTGPMASVGRSNLPVGDTFWVGTVIETTEVNARKAASLEFPLQAGDSLIVQNSHQRR
jgi:hypothetical protein